MNKLMNIFMLSCKKATGLIEKKLHFRLSKIERLQLFLHKSMCDACTAYETQSKLLDKMLKQNSDITEQHPSEKASEDFKKNLIGRLKNK